MDFFRKETRLPMDMPVNDLNNHRAFDISEDGKVITIVKKGCITHITANPDGTLHYEFELAPAA